VDRFFQVYSGGKGKLEQYLRRPLPNGRASDTEAPGLVALYAILNRNPQRLDRQTRRVLFPRRQTSDSANDFLAR